MYSNLTNGQVDSVYNIFNPADPIAYVESSSTDLMLSNTLHPCRYLLNPCVDSKYVPTPQTRIDFTDHCVRRARDLPPSVIRNVNTPLLGTFTSKVSRLFDGISGSPNTHSPSRPTSPLGVEEGVGEFELGGAAETLSGTKEERR